LKGDIILYKLKLAVLFGGCSEEHEVSIKSARELSKHIDLDKYAPIYIGITRSGVWMICEKPCPEWENGNCRPAVISPDRKTHGLISVRDGKCQTHYIDAVFPVLHGRTGEDGAIQGLLALSGIPCIGCDIQSSAICMDKSLAYTVVKAAGIAIPEFWILHSDDTPGINVSDYPVFVKPARSGSSFGVTKVADKSELDAAIETARQYDSKILIEKAVSGLEIGCAVLGSGSDLTVGEADQITLSHGIFRIHQEAHPEAGSENASFTVPANLTPEQRGQIQEAAKSIYQALGCTGLARVDMFLQADGRIVLNEVNTLPGFTSYSRYPRMMKAARITLSEIIDRLIALAMGG
jgi:D-alanine--(R)-lactate ligase